ncbi:MAG: ABC-F family ATP-binding cassette domain-containing protein [Gammaproteobacteria bacterium]
MSHKPFQIKNISVTFSHKICFEDFSATVPYGSRIAIIGRNGSGKTTLLRLILDTVDVSVGYVPQLIDDAKTHSGGERFNHALTKALSQDPELLLLDEPTNHLDVHNKKSLMRMLDAYSGTLIIASHDVALLRHCIDTMWHIDQGRVQVFTGHYDDYIREIGLKRNAIEKELTQLKQDKKNAHESLMKEQTRAAKSRSKGEKSIDKRKWPTIVSKANVLRATETTGRKKSDIRHHKEDLMDRLSSLRLPDIITPTFSITATDVGNKMLVNIQDGSVSYGKDEPILTHIFFSLLSGQRIAIIGDNGSGKSTLARAILQDPIVTVTGEWHLPKNQDIGYLDQHYGTLPADYSVLKCIQMMRPDWPPSEARRHLKDFLFRKNEEVNMNVSTLSGGEKARLSLAQISAKTPRLLILDEITNNLDLETRAHVIEVLQQYPGALIVISHDEDFLEMIGINRYWQ